MPGFITHYICGQAVARELPKDAREIIARHAGIYNMGTQGPDIFFYYLPGLLRKRTRGIGVQLHRKNVGAFMQCLTDELARAEQPEQPVLFAYVAGYLTHYALDAWAHPYVYARTSQSEPVNRKRAIRQSVNHRKLETAIDVLMLRLLSSEKPSDYRLWQLVHADAQQTSTAAKAVSMAINAAYTRALRPGDVYKAMVYMVQLTRLLQSKTGRRKRFMELAENLTIGEALVSSVIHSQEAEDGVDYLNMTKALWDTRTNKRDSFVELYQDAVADAAEMVSLLYEYMQGGVPKAGLLTRIGGRSLATGADGV